MTLRDDILRLLRENPEGLSDAELATRLGKAHQHVNQSCRQLALDGRIRRQSGFGAIRNVLSSPVRGFAPPAPQPAARPATVQDDPRWEGNVQDAIVTHLRSDGWTITSEADTATQERGIDIVAERAGRQLLVEVKGYPSTTYARGENAGQPKPTKPTLQAQMWLSHALLKTMRTRDKHSAAQVAIGLPDMPRYRTLLGEIARSLADLDILVLLVHNDRTVTAWRNDDATA